MDDIETEYINNLLIEAEEPEEVDMSEDVLGNFQKKAGRFFKIGDGETAIFDLIDYSETEDMKGNPAVAYKIKLPDVGEKIWQSGSVKLAGMIGKLPDAGRGHRIKVSRRGSSFDTMYIVELAEVDLGEEPGEAI